LSFFLERGERERERERKGKTSFDNNNNSNTFTTIKHQQQVQARCFARATLLGRKWEKRGKERGRERSFLLTKKRGFMFKCECKNGERDESEKRNRVFFSPFSLFSLNFILVFLFFARSVFWESNAGREGMSFVVPLARRRERE
jgi:hypothetical protein